MDLPRDLLRDLGLKPKHGLSSRELVRRLAAAQGGQFAVHQAAVLGMTPVQIRALRQRGDVELVRPRVNRFTTSEAPDPAVTAFLACWPHGVISHASAAQFHGLTRVQVPVHPHVTVTHGLTCRPQGITVHHSRAIGDAHILRIGPLRYASLALNVCELATSDDPWESLSTLDDAVALGATPRWINHVACELVSGRDGIALIARATRHGASDEFRSWLERAAAHIFTLGGLPRPQWNVPVRDDRGRIGVVDALWLPERVVCELKGLRFHGTATQIRHDDKRFNRLLDAGYHARSLGWRDLVDDPRGSVQTVLRAMRAGGATVDLDGVPAEITVPRAPFT